jgi:hypothetical protein
MKFFDQAGFTEPRFAQDERQLPVALPCPLPTAHQHCDFLFTTDERRQMALRRAASTSARTNHPEQRLPLWDTFKLMAATFLSDKQASDLTLHSCCD